MKTAERRVARVALTIKQRWEGREDESGSGGSPVPIMAMGRRWTCDGQARVTSTGGPAEEEKETMSSEPGSPSCVNKVLGLRSTGPPCRGRWTGTWTMDHGSWTPESAREIRREAQQAPVLVRGGRCGANLVVSEQASRARGGKACVAVKAGALRV